MPTAPSVLRPSYCSTCSCDAPPECVEPPRAEAVRPRASQGVPVVRPRRRFSRAAGAACPKQSVPGAARPQKDPRVDFEVPMVAETRPNGSAGVAPSRRHQRAEDAQGLPQSPASVGLCSRLCRAGLAHRAYFRGPGPIGLIFDMAEHIIAKTAPAMHATPSRVRLPIHLRIAIASQGDAASQ